MLAPDNKEYWSTGTYREIVPLERIVIANSFSDRNGNIVAATHYGMSKEFPLEMLITVIFEDNEGQADKTKFTLRHSDIFNISVADREKMKQDWSQSFDKLAQELTNFKGKF